MKYIADKTAKIFHQDTSSRVKMLFGHVGSGKTTACIMDIMIQFMRLPICTDNVRRGKWLVVRNTYAEIETTTLRSWLQWFPEIKFGRLYKTKPFLHKIRFKDTKLNCDCELDVYFMSMNDEDDIRKILSFEVTGFYFNEVREVPYSIIEQSLTRLAGRYPPKNLLPENTSYVQQIICDTNPPQDNHWIKVKVDDKPRPGWKIYKQPPGMIFDNEIKEWFVNEERENKLGISDDSFNQMAQSLDKETFKVYVLGEYGNIFDGMAVHAAYQAESHYSHEFIEVDENLEIYMGWDFGRTPAVVISQYINGIVYVLDELYDFYTNLDLFVQNKVIPLLNRRYSSQFNSKNIVSTADPAGMRKEDSTGVYCIEMLNYFGIPTSPAYTNSPVIRKDSLDCHLNRMIMGKPAFIVSKNCEFLNKALSGGYRYKRLGSIIREDGVPESYSEVPEKNDFSHISEACQYMTMPLFNQQRDSRKIPENYFRI